MQGALVIGPGSTSSTQRLLGCCQLAISHKPGLRTSVSITITSVWPVHCKGNASCNDSGHGSHRNGDCRVEQLPVAFNQLQVSSGLGHGVLALQLFQQAVQHCLLCRLQQRCKHVTTTRFVRVCGGPAVDPGPSWERTGGCWGPITGVSTHCDAKNAAVQPFKLIRQLLFQLLSSGCACKLLVPPARHGTQGLVASATRPVA